jgi:hypothetical protein
MLELNCYHSNILLFGRQIFFNCFCSTEVLQVLLAHSGWQTAGGDGLRRQQPTDVGRLPRRRTCKTRPPAPSVTSPASAPDPARCDSRTKDSSTSPRRSWSKYHVVILLLKLGSNKQVNKTQIHPSKTTHHFGAQTIRAVSTLGTAPPPLYFSIQFLNLDQTIFCTIQRCLLDVNKLLRNQVSLRQHIFFYKRKQQIQ